MKKVRQLTEMQIAFLDALFGDAKGDAEKAKELAGYSKNVRTREIISSLRDEIIELSKEILSVNAPRAALEMVSVMLQPDQSGASNKLKAAQEVLNRNNVVQQAQGVDLKVPEGGLIILPAKKKAEVVDEEDKEG